VEIMVIMLVIMDENNKEGDLAEYDPMIGMGSGECDTRWRGRDEDAMGEMKMRVIDTSFVSNAKK